MPIIQKRSEVVSRIFHILAETTKNTEDMAKTGSKDTTAIAKAAAQIEKLTSMLKAKRLTVEQYSKLAAQEIASMSSEKDFAAYMKMVGYHEKLGVDQKEAEAETPAPAEQKEAEPEKEQA